MKFIVIEGLDGSGKSTAARLLAERIKLNGAPCHITKEPTKSQIGMLIRSVLAGDDPNFYSALPFLFAADRLLHIKGELLPALESCNVVCDRYYYSNMAYQSSTPESLERAVSLNQPAMNLCRPDITFFINVSPAECMRRIEARGERVSIFESLPKLEYLHDRYIAVFARMESTDSIVFVGSDTATPEDVVVEMLQHISYLD